MPVRRVVWNEVEDDLEAVTVSGRDKLIEVGHVAERGIDCPIIGNVIAEVSHRRLENGIDPDCIGAEFDHMRQALDNSLEISNSRSAAVLKRARINLVDDTGLPPGCGFHSSVTRGA